MKVILLQDVKSLGKKGELLEINDGYARNYVLPKKLGVEATEANMNTLKLQKANQEKIAKETLEKAQEFGKALESKKVKLSVKVGEGGKVFGAITAKEIAKVALEQHGMEIDKKKIQLPEAIKSSGTYEVPVKLHPQVTAKLTVDVCEG